MVPDVKTRLLLVLALMLPVANAAWAVSAGDEASQAGSPAPEPAAAAPAASAGAPAAVPSRAADTPPPMRMAPAARSGKPSGFWGSSRPAVGGAYRYRLLGIGVAVVLLTLGIMMWILRRPARGSSRPGAA